MWRGGYVRSYDSRARALNQKIHILKSDPGTSPSTPDRNQRNLQRMSPRKKKRWGIIALTFEWKTVNWGRKRREIGKESIK